MKSFLNRIFLEEILEKLEGEEKRLIVFRYFQDMTQTEVAKKNGNVPGSDFQDGEKDIEEAERNLPQIVMHILQRAFLNTLLEKEKKAKYFLIFSRALLGVRI